MMHGGSYARYAPNLARVSACLVVGFLSADSLAQAIPGEPFGVATIAVPVSGEASPEFYRTGGFALTEEHHRAFYPIFERNGLLGRLEQRLHGGDVEASGRVSVSFLFKGSEPLQLTVWTPDPQRVELIPDLESPRVYRRLMSRWWRGYHAAARQQRRSGDHPPLVYTYLTSMLGQRLRRPAPVLSRLPENAANVPQATLERLAGAEKLRDATMRSTMEERNAVAEEADLPLPSDVLWSTPVPADVDAPIDVEPIAMHVPEECFYIRFGSFANYMWFSHLLREHGGDLGRMISLRGHDAGLNDRLQRQLALKESALAELLGGNVTADVAILGRDAFLREGAAIGILFLAKNNLALAADVTRQRTEALAAEKQNGATLETVSIGSHKASFLSTPDHRLRSYYGADGVYHLVTTSRAMMERFFAAGAGDRALGQSAEFLRARSWMPLSRDDTIFAYFSSAFFRGLLSPQYQIELKRRLEAVTDIELVQLARLAAAHERLPGHTVEELVAARLLPPGFGRRAGGSGPILETERVLDSLRGARGSFLPIPDVDVRGATRTEVARYAEHAAYYQANWRQLDPLMVGVRRFAVNREGRERLIIDANISPLGEEKYGWLLSLLGPATPRRVRPATGDIISLQGWVTGGMLSPIIPPHHLFVGVQDIPIDTELLPRDAGKTLRLLRATPGYLGAWPETGFLDQLPFELAGAPDLDGFSTLPLGLWRWQGDAFSVLSFHRNVLAHVGPQLQVEETEGPAQVRAHVGDLAGSHLATLVNALNYQRAYQASLGNVRLLHTLSHQLGVPREQALRTANQLLDTRLICSLDGKYELVKADGGPSRWRSRGWPAGGNARLPEDYEAPLLTWFRGLELEVTKSGDRLTAHAELEMQRAKRQSPLDLPLFHLFGRE
ncbi:MAG: hypothetical protein ACC628_15430 [Pirellulaceae bacterium]